MTHGGPPRVVLVLPRYLIAGILGATAAGKLLDVPGFAAVLRTYEAFLPASLLPIAIAVTVSEGFLAFWLVTGRRLPAAAAASAAMHTAYGVFSALTLARGLRPTNCGCFGVFLARPLTWATVAEDGALAALSLTLAVLARRCA